MPGMQDTHRTLMPAKHSATSGHVTLLKQKMLTAILRRLDAILFDKLTAGRSPSQLWLALLCSLAPCARWPKAICGVACM